MRSFLCQATELWVAGRRTYYFARLGIAQSWTLDSSCGGRQTEEGNEITTELAYKEVSVDRHIATRTQTVK